MHGDPITATVLNYTKLKLPFQHTIVVEPVVNSTGSVELFKVTSQGVVSLLDLMDAIDVDTRAMQNEIRAEKRQRTMCTLQLEAPELYNDEVFPQHKYEPHPSESDASSD